MATDKRVRAGANLDGTFSKPIPDAAVGRRPFLMIGTQIDHNVGGSDASWGDTWAGLHGWKRWLTVAGTVHFSFTDLPVLSAEVGLPTPNGQTPPVRAMGITRTYLGAFFAQQLKGIPQPLLDGPSPTDPEVAFPNPWARHGRSLRASRRPRCLSCGGNHQRLSASAGDTRRLKRSVTTTGLQGAAESGVPSGPPQDRDHRGVVLQRAAHVALDVVGEQTEQRVRVLGGVDGQGLDPGEERVEPAVAVPGLDQSVGS
ncbi:hypothetical protein ABH940_000686 [Streptacidiphilus sp. BW17]